VSYDPVCRDTDPADHAQFDITFDRDTELTGYMKLRVFMSAEGPTISTCSSACTSSIATANSFRWRTTRSSMTARSRSAGCAHRTASSIRKIHGLAAGPTHTREQKLNPGEIVPLDIEIWPSSTRFAAGEKLRLIVQGTDINRYPKDKVPVYFRHEASVNRAGT
jgi:Predicted acyl esterases